MKDREKDGEKDGERMRASYCFCVMMGLFMLLF